MKGTVAERPKPRKERWEREVLAPALAQTTERAAEFTTISGQRIERLYSDEDVATLDYGRDLADPGKFPYTRGIHPTGYARKALDDAAVCRIRYARGNQPALQGVAGTRAAPV